MDEERGDEARRILQFERMIRFPEDIASKVRGWENDRKFVATLCNQQDTEDTVVTNHILRGIQASVAASTLPNPCPRFKSAGYLPEQDHPDPAIQQLAMQDGNPINRYPIGWPTYTKTQEILITKQLELSGFTEVLHDLNHEARYSDIIWMKVRWIQDDASDPLGQPLPSEQSKLRRYLSLYEAYEAGDFTEDDAPYHELAQISEDLKKQARAELEESLSMTPAESPVDVLGLPLPDESDPRIEELEDLESDSLFSPDEILLAPSYQGYEFEVIDPEDIRFEWTARRPSDLRRSRWLAHRNWMLPADIEEVWGSDWTEDDKQAVFNRGTQQAHADSATGTSATTDKTLEKEDVEPQAVIDLEDSRRGKRRAVWEYWDLVERRRYRWVQGGERLLDDVELEKVPRRLHPFFPLVLNHVAGSVFGLSDVEMGRPAQEWLNLVQTHDRQARRSAYPRWLVEAGILGPDELQALQAAKPYSVTETKRPVDDIRKAVWPFPAEYNPVLGATDGALAAMETSLGIAASRMGAASSGAKHATTEAIANQGFGDRTGAARDAQLRLCKDVFEYMAQMNALRMSGDNVRELVGPGGYWPVEQMEHSQILSNFMVRATAAPSEEAEQQRRMGLLQTAAGVIQTAGLPVNRVWFVQKMAEAMGAADEVEQMIDLNLLLNPPEPQPGGPQPTSPEDQGERGDEGGRPPMAEQEPEISPETIPNRPNPQG